MSSLNNGLFMGYVWVVCGLVGYKPHYNAWMMHIQVGSTPIFGLGMAHQLPSTKKTYKVPPPPSDNDPQLTMLL